MLLAGSNEAGMSRVYRGGSGPGPFTMPCAQDIARVMSGDAVT